MLVKEIMLQHPHTLFITETLTDACSIYNQQGVNCAPVVDENGKVVGILTVFRVLQALEKGMPFSTPVSKVMDENITTFCEETHFNEVCNLPVDRLVILNKNGHLSGVLTRIDLINKVYGLLEETEYALSVMLQSIRNGIIGVDVSGNVCHFNAAAEQLTGLQAIKVLGRSVDSLLQHIGLAQINTEFDGFLGRFTVGEHVIIIHQSPIKKDKQSVCGYVLVLQDISELEKISSELQSVQMLNKELSGVIQSCYDGIVVMDSLGNILRVNDSYSRITGEESSKTLPGRNVAALMNGPHRQLYSIYKEILSGKAICNLAIRTADGKDIVFSGSSVTDEADRVVQIVVNLRDITELNQFKTEAARAAAELGELRVRQLKKGEIIAKSNSMRRTVEQAMRVAGTDSTVLITGPSGVGKEKLAGYIHRHSTRENKPFVCINCGAIPESLLESELFGYEKGAFTGAQREGKLGLLEIANEGTVFLDEIGDMPLNMQVKLLRVLQEHTIYRVGGSKPITLNIRVIAATNKELKQLIREQKFREDLYYRLNVVPLYIAPLQDRREDILPLALFFLKHFNVKNSTKKRLGPDTCRLLESYSWPGNVRELMNVMERIVIMCDEDVVVPRHLPTEFKETMEMEEWRPTMVDIMPLQQATQATEKELIKLALQKYHTLRGTAKVLGISHSTLLRKVHQYGIVVQN